jgi:hypothetical protein
LHGFLACAIVKVKKYLPSVKIQNMDGKVCLSCKGKTLLGIVNKILIFESLLTTTSNVMP